MRKDWFGDYDQCTRVSTKVNVNGTIEHWAGTYTSIYYSGQIPNTYQWNTFYVGFCATPKCKTYFDKSPSCK